MRIVQVVTYLSADGAYGGPVAVARRQCAALAARGHEVRLVAAWDGVVSTDLDGVDVRPHRAFQLPGLGFAGLSSPGAWRDVRRLSRGADVVHLHYARDLVQLPSAAAVAAGTPVVLQVHGMIRPDDRAAARVLDAAFVRRAYRRAAAHLALTDAEVDDLPRVADSTGRVERVRNAVSLPDRQASYDARPTVVYVARLHERKRPLAFVAMADELIRRGSTARFVLHGPDAGEGAAVSAEITRLGHGDRIAYLGPLAPDLVGDVLAAAQVYVLPSVEEPFPMSLLEAMSHGLPSVITDRTGLSDELARRRTALVTDGSPASMADAVQGVLTDAQAWRSASDRARADIVENFAPEAMARTLEEIYADAISRRG